MREHIGVCVRVGSRQHALGAETVVLDSQFSDVTQYDRGRLAVVGHPLHCIKLHHQHDEKDFRRAVLVSNSVTRYRASTYL